MILGHDRNSYKNTNTSCRSKWCDRFSLISDLSWDFSLTFINPGYVYLSSLLIQISSNSQSKSKAALNKVFYLCHNFMIVYRTYDFFQFFESGYIPKNCSVPYGRSTAIVIPLLDDDKKSKNHVLNLNFW